MIGWLIDWWGRHGSTAPRITSIVTYASQGDLPDSLPRRRLALVGSPERPKWAALECPCGTGHRLLINLSAAHKPTWRIESPAPPSLRPSIDYEDAARRCHFWLR